METTCLNALHIVVLYYMLVILHTQVTQPFQPSPFDKYVYH